MTFPPAHWLNAGGGDDANSVDDLPDDPRLLALAQEYLARLETGDVPSVDEYVTRHPDLADAIRTCLDGLLLIHRTVKPTAIPERPRVTTTVSDTTQGTGEPLGDFRILRELGRGGMGVVYEAVQTSLGRRVALKVLPFTATLQPRQLQRFLNEAQAAAHLHHPHIVPVFAVGCDRGVHYYAMQLIEGLSLAELIDNLRRDAGWTATEPEPLRAHTADDSSPLAPPAGPADPTMAHYSSRLSTEQTSGKADYFRTVARFGFQAAEALAYAHELGVVHRDVKPANLMIDARGKVWVTDFGLAQIRSGTELTQTGDLLGTLRYMSPEQVQGDRTLVDQRADVYSLGATLYELATLRPLFSGSSREQLLHQVLNGEPTAPRGLNKAVPTELETIICKAISKSAGDRYPTAQHLADDLQRFLSDQPILARRPTLFDRVRKWARRHPSAVIATGFVLLLMTVGLLIHNRLIAQQQSLTKASLEREYQRAQEAEQSFRQAREAVDLLIQIGEEEMADKPFAQAARKRLLSAALAYYQDFVAQQDEDPASRLELAAVETRVKGILRELSLGYTLFQVTLVGDDDVQQDLQITPEQQLQLAEFLRESGHQGGALFSETPASSEARRQLFVAFAETQTARLADILTEPQQQRLKQIMLQSQGLFAFQEPDIIDALQLTSEQRRSIREIEFQAVFGRGPRHFPEGRPPLDFRGPPPNREEDDRRRRDAVQQVVALLEPEQRERWELLTGPPFIGRVMQMHHGMPFGPPPGPPHGEPPRNGPRRGFREPPPLPIPTPSLKPPSTPPPVPR